MSAKHYQGYSTLTNVADKNDTIYAICGCCPVCRANERKEYRFDKWGDVLLQTYQCRKHFTVTKFDGFDVWVCDSYQEAEGVARLTAAVIDAKYGALDR